MTKANTANKAIKGKKAEHILENVLMVTDCKKKKLYLEIDLKGFDKASMGNAIGSDYVQTGQGNYRVASTMGNVALDVPGYEHIKVGLNVFSLKQDVEAIQATYAQAALAKQIQAELDAKKAPVEPTPAPAGDNMAVLKAAVSANPELLGTLPAEVQTKLILALLG